VVIVSNLCNKKTPDGNLIVANGTLTSSQQPANGRYNETIGPTHASVAYNIIALKTDEYSVEYDCGQEFGFTNYCVHILSRQPTLNATTVNNLLKLAELYDLNPAKLDFVLTKQLNCAYNKPIGST
jgi:lipocalin